jgi:hypothetical protein
LKSSIKLIFFHTLIIVFAEKEIGIVSRPPVDTIKQDGFIRRIFVLQPEIVALLLNNRVKLPCVPNKILPRVPNAEVTNYFFNFGLLWMEIGADFAEPPFGQLGGVQLIHSDTAVRRRTLADATQNRPRPHDFRHFLLTSSFLSV